MRLVPSPTTLMKNASLPLLALVASLAAGCATVQVTQPTQQPEAAPPVEADLARWHFDAGNRPPADPDGYRPPVKLGVLLPLTGSLATAAKPVRDGLLAAYYAESRRRPELVFYDTGGTSGGAGAAYAKAVAEGVDQVLGPLGREEIDAVYRGVQPGTPVIALNRGATVPPANSASFSLAPEDEGSGAADYLLSRNARNVLVLAGSGEYERRSVAAFTARLQLNGGTVVQALPVSGDKPADMTPALQAAAQREGGVDAVFMALRGPQARAIAPQLAAAGLLAKPRVATSMITSGTSKPETDKVLDGIAFPTESWQVGNVPGIGNAANTGSQLPTARGGAARLFAFGYDAWRLAAYLEHLALAQDGKVDGATGVLRIGADGNVVRTPAWSTFSSGVQVPLAGAGG